jgi:citrate lyase subunit beta/citryl-CoA lyase
MVDLKDIDGLIADAKKAKAYGFMGKALIHPNQIEPCNEIFTPSPKEIEEAGKIIAAFEEAEREGRAAIQLEGRFIDYPVVEKARLIVELARVIAGN